MLTEFKRSTLGPSTTLYSLNTEEYKTITVRFYGKQKLVPKQNTMTALVMRLLQHGSASHPSRLQLARHLENLFGASLETGVGKAGPHQLTHVHLEVADPRFLPSQLEVFRLALDTALEVMTKPSALCETPSEAILAQEKEYLAQDIRGLVDDKARYSIFRCNQEMFGSTPNALSEMGTREDLEQVQSETLPAHYQALLATAEMNIFLVGDFSPADLQLIEQIGSRRAGEDASYDGRQFPDRDQPQEIIEEADVSQARICLGLRCPTPPDHHDYYARAVYNGVLGGFPHSKLFINLREKAHLAYDVWSFLNPVPGVQYIMAGVHPEHYQAALEIIDQQRQHIQEGRISRQELDATKKGLSNRLRGITDTPERLIGAAMADLLANRQASKEEQLSAIASIEVEDIIRVAEQVKPDTTLVLLPRGGSHS